MAVQKSKKSRSKKGSRHSSNSKLILNEISLEKESNEIHLRHHVTEKGYYKGVKVISKNIYIKDKNKKNKK